MAAAPIKANFIMVSKTVEQEHGNAASIPPITFL
jgi:hypothetical protein